MVVVKSSRVVLLLSAVDSNIKNKQNQNNKTHVSEVDYGSF